MRHYNNSEYSISLSCWIDNNRTVGWQQHTDEGLWSNSQVVKPVHIRSKIFTWSHKLKSLLQREYQLPWEGRNWELWNMFDTGMTSCQRKITAALSKSFSQREHFYHTLFSPVDLAFSRSRTSNHCHGDRSTCELSHCAAPVRLWKKGKVMALSPAPGAGVRSTVRHSLESCSIRAGLAGWPRQGQVPRASAHAWGLAQQDSRHLPALFTGSSWQAELVFIFCAFKSSIYFMKLKYKPAFPGSHNTITIPKTPY